MCETEAHIWGNSRKTGEGPMWEQTNWGSNPGSLIVVGQEISSMSVLPGQTVRTGKLPGYWSSVPKLQSPGALSRGSIQGSDSAQFRPLAGAPLEREARVPILAGSVTLGTSLHLRSAPQRGGWHGDLSPKGCFAPVMSGRRNAWPSSWHAVAVGKCEPSECN